MRAFTSILGICGLMLLLCLSTRIQDISTHAFLAFLTLITLLASACTSYLQQASVSLSALFGASYLQGILSGQGAIGVAVAIAQFVSALSSVSTMGATDDEALRAMADSIRLTAFIFFLIAFIFSLTALVAHAGFLRIPFCRLTLQEAEDARLTRPVHQLYHLRTVERKIRTLGFAVAGVFVVTLAVFPSITASVLSVNDGPGRSALFSPPLFVPLGFVAFNVADYLGRTLPHFKPFIFLRVKGLLAASIARIVFVVRFRSLVGRY
jgi:equilibrative nucleoside transporter 1/2/3